MKTRIKDLHSSINHIQRHMKPSAHGTTNISPHNKIVVSLDSVSSKEILGWANHPFEYPCHVDIYSDNKWIARVPADQYRPDLEKAGIRNGKAMFLIRTPLHLIDNETHDIHAIARFGEEKIKSRTIKSNLTKTQDPLRQVSTKNYKQIYEPKQIAAGELFKALNFDTELKIKSETSCELSTLLTEKFQRASEAAIINLRYAHILPWGVPKTAAGEIAFESFTGLAGPNQYRPIEPVSSNHYQIQERYKTISYIEDEVVHLLTAGSPFNHYHLLCEVGASIWFMKRHRMLENRPILINRNWFRDPHAVSEDRFTEVIRFLEQVSECSIYQVDSDIVRCKKAVFCLYTRAPVYEAVSDAFYTKKTLSQQGKSMVYISRSKASVRRITNEDELVKRLARFGFETIHAEDYSMDEQADLFFHARIVIAPHGAALSNCVYCRPGTKVIEVLSDSGSARGRIFAPIYAARILDPYYYIGRSINIRQNGDSDITIDVNTFIDYLTPLVNGE